MLSLMLCATVLVSPPITELYRPDFFWLASSREWKDHAYITPDSSQDKHVLHLQFNTEGRKYVGGSSVTRCISVYAPHGFGVGDPGDVESGIDPVLASASWLPSFISGGTWIHKFINSDNDVTLAYHKLSGSELIGDDSLTVIYRETATVSMVVHTYAYAAKLKVYKQEASGDAPIDSRLIYGSPNETWETVDANGDARNMIFNPWIFRGGLFVGNMPIGTGDRSGMARTQLWFPEITGTYAAADLENLQFAHVSLMSLGFWPIPTGTVPGDEDDWPWQDLNIGVWGVDDAETETESNAKWSNRWLSALTGSTGAPPPISVEAFGDWSSTTSRDFANWRLVEADETDVTFDSDAFEKLFLAIEQEEDVVTSIARWRYFVGKEMVAGTYPGGVNTNIPTTDMNPRVWAICIRAIDEYENPEPGR